MQAKSEQSATIFSSRLMDAMQRRGFTQAKLGEEMGVSQNAVWQWLHGVSIPRGDKMAALSNALGISISELLTGQPVTHFLTHRGRGAPGPPVSAEEKRNAALAARIATLPPEKRKLIEDLLKALEG